MAELKELGTLIVVVGKAVRRDLICSFERKVRWADEVEELAEQVEVWETGSILYCSRWWGETADESYQAVRLSFLSLWLRNEKEGANHAVVDNTQNGMKNSDSR